MYSSIDLLIAKIERQVRRYKERIRDHKPHVSPGVPMRTSVLSAESVDASGAPAEMEPRPRGKKTAAPTAPAAQKAQIIKSSKFFAKPMAVEEAVMQMDLLSNDFLVFMNAASMQVAVVYRRKDGNYGLIETGIAQAASASAPVDSEARPKAS
jgi:putative sigma-54 modulation protein